ncbi:MAG: GNAT family N-acetyltransferase [Pseudobacteriovorax sp.]|nr:GNAT family N-acetyltransferase [Pseudobacteriovorax sp.]
MSLLTAENISLRRMNSDDVASFVDRYDSFSEDDPYWPHFFASESALQSKIAEDGFWSEDRGLLLICPKTYGDFIGFVSFGKTIAYYPHAREVTIRIFEKENRRKGYAMESLKLFSRFCYESFPLERLWAGTSTKNQATCRLFESAGYKLEGVWRKGLYIRGEYHDENIYSWLRSDYLGKDLPQN